VHFGSRRHDKRDKKALPPNSSEISWDTVREIYVKLLDADPSSRHELLVELCESNDLLRQEVESLIEADAVAGHFLESPLNIQAASIVSESERHSLEGCMLGNYSVGRRIGRGASSVVHEAFQENPARTVALKIFGTNPLTSDISKSLIKRETRALALLNHASIANIYETGFDGGFHYFAMELIEGIALTNYAREGDLTLVDRLQMFCDVCDAVQYAHQRGVIHRDLKPSNILVTTEGNPKILDFGLAKVAETDADQSRLSEIGSFVGTLQYMSPEQGAASADEIDARTDVYSLGVMLFEIISGKLPYETKGLGLSAAVRTIAEKLPSRDDLKGVPGDLVTVTLKAMEKDPNDRYTSATALGDDIRHFMRDQPIAARPPRATYQLKKMIQRHKLASAMSACMILVLIVFGFGMTALYRRAVTETETSAAVMDLMFETIDTANHEGPGNAYTVRELLVDLERQFGNQLVDHPRIEARLHQSLAKAYVFVGQYDSSEYHASQALEAWRSGLFGDGMQLADGYYLLGWDFHGVHKYEIAEELFREALEIRRAELGDVHESVADVEVALGDILGHLGRIDEAEVLMNSSIEHYRQVGRANSREEALAHTFYGAMLSDVGRLSDAESALREAWRINLEIQKDQTLDHEGWELTGREFGEVLVNQGKYAEAEPVLDRVLTEHLKELPVDHFYIARTRALMGRVWAGTGRFKEAETLLLRAVSELNRTGRLGQKGYREVAHALENLYDKWGQPDEAAHWRTSWASQPSPPAKSASQSESS
jgi:eukaryotic-like serine/threonine-protein kinase